MFGKAIRLPRAETVIDAGAGLAAIALDTPLPLASIVKLGREALVRDAESQQWERSFIAGVRRWILNHPDLVAQTGMEAVEGWEGRIVQEFNDRGASSMLGSAPEARNTAIDIIAKAVFPPATVAGWDASRNVASRLLADLPDIVIDSSDKASIALRAVLGRELGAILDAIGELAAVLPRRVDQRIAIDAYLAALATPQPDGWARLIGGTNRSLTDGFIDRAIRLRGPIDPMFSATEALDASERLVIVGEAGSGKSWLVRYLAVRAALTARAILGDDGEELDVEIPLVANASEVLDARSQASPWEALTRAAVARVAERLGDAGAEAVRSRIDHLDGRYLVLLDGLDEAVSHADSDRLDRLIATPGRRICVALTTRPVAWRLQLDLNPTLSWDASKPLVKQPGRHLLTDLEPLDADEIRVLVHHLLEHDPPARDKLLELINGDPAIASLAQTPLACVMLAATAADRSRGVPWRGVVLYERVVTLLLRSTWRGDLAPEALIQARSAARRLADASAIDDSATGLGASSSEVAAPLEGLTAASSAALDVVAPVVAFDPGAMTQTRVFIHETVRAHLLGEHIATLAAEEAAARLASHLWFDPEWADVVPVALALHARPSAVLRSLLEIPDAGRIGVGPIKALDGFGELRRLVARLTRDTDAARWDHDARSALNAISVEQLRVGDGRRARLELIRGGWDVDLTRDEHVDRLANGTIPWPTHDLVEGLAWLGLSDEELASVARALVPRLAALEVDLLSDAAAILDVTLVGPLAGLREEVRDVLVARLIEDPTDVPVGAVMPFRPDHDELRRAAATIVDRIERARGTYLDGHYVSELVQAAEALTVDPDLLNRSASKMKQLLLAQDDREDLLAYEGGVQTLRHLAAAPTDVIAHVLRMMRGQGGYETRQLESFAWKLVFDERGPETLDGLLSTPPTEWPAWYAFLSLIDRLAAASEPVRLAQVRQRLIGRLATCHLRDLHRYTEILLRLEPPDGELRDVQDDLLARLTSTPPEHSLSAAIALRETHPASGVRAAAADHIVALADAADHPGLRFALARGALWFRPEEGARATTLSILASHVVGVDPATFQDLINWLAEDEATEGDRQVLLPPVLRLIESGATGLGAGEVAAKVSDLALRQETARVFLQRASARPDHYPGDWVIPAAELGTPAKQLEALNDAVVEALAIGEFLGGRTFDLTRMWAVAPLTDEQRVAASRHLVDRIGAARPSEVRNIADLMSDIDPPTDLRQAAVERLKERLVVASDDYDREQVHEAMDLIAGPAPAYLKDLADELCREFGVRDARELIARQPGRGIESQVAACLISSVRRWDKARYGAADPQELERLADDLRITVGDLSSSGIDPRTSSPGTRALAASARRRTSHQDWRAFLKDGRYKT